MARYVAFLRAINVGGRFVKMDVLRGVFEALRLARVETFIASGNVVFETRSNDMPALERRIETRLHEALGFEVHTFVRACADVARIAAHPAFDAAAVAEAAAHVVGFVAEPLKPAAAAALMALRSDLDDFHADGREIYWLSRNKQSDSPVSNALLERRLGVRTTMRNVSMLRRLAAQFAPRRGLLPRA